MNTLLTAKCYINLYEHIQIIIHFLQRKSKSKKYLIADLLFLSKLIIIETKINLKQIYINYSFNIENLNEHINAIIYVLKLYDFPKIFKKSIRRFEKYHLRHQKT
jgi:hypothetical protein